MQVTGTTYLAYAPPRPAVLAKLRTMVDAQRAISHNQSTYWMEGKFWPHEYLDAVRELFSVYEFGAVYDTLNHEALPIHGADWKTADKSFDAAVFVQWAKEYVRYMAQPGCNYRLVWGNEPDADGCPYLHDEDAFRLRYALLVQAVTELEADDTFKGNVSLGAGGWVQDWARAGDFVAWCKDNGTRLDFVDVHIYQDPSRLAAARDAIGPDMPIAILESGAEWDHTIKPPTAPKQKAWFRGMDKATDADGNVIAWHIMHGAGASNVQALALMGARGALTPLGKMVA